MQDNRRSEVFRRLSDIIRTELNREDVVIKEDTTALDVPGWDSLHHISIIIAVETSFGLRLKTSEVARIQNVSGLVDIILARGRF
jgi:acyl carrier protein